MRLIFFDAEISGLSPAQGAWVIEIGAVAVRGGAVEAEFATLIGVDCAIHPAAQRVHGIDRAMLAGRPGPAAVSDRNLLFTACADIARILPSVT